jgi:hypothetical protein
MKAVYRGGKFEPESAPDLPEGAEVELTVDGPYEIPAVVTDPEKRAAILRELIDSMNNNPIPKDAPRFTREELYERR